MPSNDIVEGIALWVWTFSGVKTYGLLSGWWWRLCTIPFLEASLLELMDFWWCLVRWLCASLFLLGHYVIAEAGYNWYLRDIIFPLSKKRTNVSGACSPTCKWEDKYKICALRTKNKIINYICMADQLASKYLRIFFCKS
jgi:hypothetical protein